VWIQTKGVLFMVVLTCIILNLVDLAIGLRVTAEQETDGLDLSQHGERGYIL